MFRLLKALVLIVVLVVVAAFLLGWWGGRIDPREAVGTTGVDTQRAREVGAQVGEKTATAVETVGEKTAVAADQARRALAEGGLTAKIKAKMALDDSVKALNLNVDTVGTVVTVTGTVESEAQRQRALQLARETAGVTQVVDRIKIRQ